MIRDKINKILDSLSEEELDNVYRSIVPIQEKKDKTVTFSFSSRNYKDIKVTETFTLKKLGIDEDNMDDETLKKVIDDIFQLWVWDKLNISYSIIVDEDKRTY